jgi:hypothetical protein
MKLFYFDHSYEDSGENKKRNDFNLKNSIDYTIFFQIKIEMHFMICLFFIFWPNI